MRNLYGKLRSNPRGRGRLLETHYLIAPAQFPIGFSGGSARTWTVTQVVQVGSDRRLRFGFGLHTGGGSAPGRRCQGAMQPVILTGAYTTSPEEQTVTYIRQRVRIRNSLPRTHMPKCRRVDLYVSNIASNSCAPLPRPPGSPLPTSYWKKEPPQ